MMFTSHRYILSLKNLLDTYYPIEHVPTSPHCVVHASAFGYLLFTSFNAASAFCRSLSLKFLDTPRAGVLTPDPARERTFVTSGLQHCGYERLQRETKNR